MPTASAAMLCCGWSSGSQGGGGIRNSYVLTSEGVPGAIYLELPARLVLQRISGRPRSDQRWPLLRDSGSGGVWKQAFGSKLIRTLCCDGWLAHALPLGPPLAGVGATRCGKLRQSCPAAEVRRRSSLQIYRG